MIKQEIIGNKYRKTYSDRGFYIIKAGTAEKYEVALDVISKNYVYLETQEKIEKKDKTKESE